MPFYRSIAIYSRASWDHFWGDNNGEGNDFCAVNTGLPTWRGHQFFSLAMGLAMVVGPWIGLNMARHSAYIEAFWLCTGVSIVSIVLALIVAVPPVIRHADGSKPKLGFAAMFDRAAMPFAPSPSL